MNGKVPLWVELACTLAACAAFVGAWYLLAPAPVVPRGLVDGKLVDVVDAATGEVLATVPMRVKLTRPPPAAA
jgi:hypothetical protein